MNSLLEARKTRRNSSTIAQRGAVAVAEKFEQRAQVRKLEEIYFEAMQPSDASFAEELPQFLARSGRTKDALPRVPARRNRECGSAIRILQQTNRDLD